MILNEDYFKDLEIENDDIIEDDILDVEKPKMTLDDFYKLPEQYDYLIKIMVEKRDNTDTTLFFQTSLLPRITKRLDAIFDMYGIEHSEYILTPSYYAGDSNTIVDFGNYQLFCQEDEKYAYINEIYRDFYICAYANYPKFSYKRAFRFIYTMLNIFKFDEHFCIIKFVPTKQQTMDREIGFIYHSFYYQMLRFMYDLDKDTILYDSRHGMDPSKKRIFYNYVARHFFGKDAKVDYKAIDRDVPLKPFLNN